MTATARPTTTQTSAAPGQYSLGSPRADALLKAARDLGPVLEARLETCASDRQVPEQTIADFHDAGFFRILQAGEYGGYEMDPQVFYAVLLEIAKTCMSSAWVLGVVGVHNWQLNLFDAEAAEEVWADSRDVLISSSYAPVGKVTPVDGGFRLSGRWSFSSGCEHCDWVFLGAVVPTAEAPWDMLNYRTFLLPKEDYQIVDNWDVVGLEGTGSHDIVVNDAFVPEHRTHRMVEDDGGRKFMHKPPLYRLPFMQVFSRAVSTPSLGALEGALEKYIYIAQNRLAGMIAMKDDPNARRLAAEVDAAIASMKTTLFQNFDQLMDHARAGEVATLLDRARFRYNTSVVADTCVGLSSRMLKSAGSTGIRNSGALLKQHRDILTSQAHIANVSEPLAANLGGMLFGQETTDLNI
jgi:3-hydroxy-9,10-secoandrosta-1,3,5(10)-triene-9,17-dione monooxygenase